MRRLIHAVALVMLAGCAADSPPRDVARADREGPAATEARSDAKGAGAREPDLSRPLGVDDCVKIACGSALTARGFEARLRAARGVAEAAAAWPNPTFDYTAEDIGLVNGGKRQLQQQEAIGYPVFTFWTKGLEADVARADEARTEAQIEDDRRQLRLEVGRAFYELLASDEAVKNELQAVLVAERLADATAKRLRLGDASALDEQRARTEALQARRDLSTARRQRAVDGISFALALGASKPVAIELAAGWPSALPASVAAASTESLVERAVARRPDVRAAEAGVERATRASELEGRRAFPLADWTVTIGARQGPNGSHGGPGALFGIGGPVPIVQRNAGSRLRAQAELETAVVELEQARRRVAFDVESSLVAWASATGSVAELAEPIAHAREAALDATRRLFAAGEVSYLDVLQAERDAVAARRSLVDARKEAALARWRLIVATTGGDD